MHKLQRCLRKLNNGRFRESKLMRRNLRRKCEGRQIWTQKEKRTRNSFSHSTLHMHWIIKINQSKSNVMSLLLRWKKSTRFHSSNIPFITFMGWKKVSQIVWKNQNLLNYLQITWLLLQMKLTPVSNSNEVLVWLIVGIAKN